MEIIIESILAGVWATFVMDMFAKILAKRKLIHPFVSQEELGRWFLYMFRGKMVHKNISKTTPLKNEKTAYYASHYMIGIFLAGFYLLLANLVAFVNENEWLTVVFGVLTIILPWFWLLPGLGFGFTANRSPDRARILKTNLINHTNFGIGLFLWVLLFHRFFLNI